MAAGILKSIELELETNTLIYEVPSNIISSFSVNICNRNTSAVRIRLALATTSSPDNSEYIEYDTVIPGFGVLERTGIILGEGKCVVAFSNLDGVSVSVWGYEEDL